MNNKPAEFWLWLREQLREIDMRPVQFAEHAGISRPVLARYLNGTTDAPDLPNGRPRSAPPCPLRGTGPAEGDKP